MPYNTRDYDRFTDAKAQQTAEMMHDYNAAARRKARDLTPLDSIRDHLQNARNASGGAPEIVRWADAAWALALQMFQ
jgi:hypothetical protein